MIKDYDIAIVGAGAAGLLAALGAARQGARVLVLEKMEKTGRKVRISGKGRCNITNACRYDQFLSKINTNPAFFRWAFNSMQPNDILNLLHDMDVETVVERGERVFPKSNRAWDVATALLDAAQDAGAEIHTFKQVTDIIATDGKISAIEYVDTESGARSYINIKAIILATGGLSYPRTGSTGDGYKMLEKFGHYIVPTHPSLVPLKVKQIEFSKLKGLLLKNVEVSLDIEGKTEDVEFGEVEFLDNGIGGAAVIRLSRKASLALGESKNVSLTLNLKSALTEEQLHDRISRDIKSGEYENAEKLMEGLLPRKLIKPFASYHKIGLKKLVADYEEADISKLIRTLQSTRLNVIGTAGFEGAIVTVGGLSLKHVDPKTMESKRVKGLYIAGELLDLDGPTGGFNLQIAFSTGYLAGISAAKQVRE